MMGYLMQMLEMLTSAYTRKDIENLQKLKPLETNIGKLFFLLAESFDRSHEMFEIIRDWDNIDNAEGAALDRYGRNYGVECGGTSDVFYRLMIKVKVLSHLSGGDTDTIINAASILFDMDPARIDYRDVYPAKVALFIKESDMTEENKQTAALIMQLIKRIVGAGIWIDISFAIPYIISSDFCVGGGVHSSRILPVGVAEVKPEPVSITSGISGGVHPSSQIPIAIPDSNGMNIQAVPFIQLGHFSYYTLTIGGVENYG